MSSGMRKTTRHLVLAVALLCGAAMGQNPACSDDGSGTFVNDHGEFEVLGGQVSMAGATLFVDFFTTPASTNDWIDADGDGFAGFDPNTFPFVDQLARQFTPGEDLSTWWLFQYRSVGSVRGFNEFVESQTCGVIPTSVPSEAGQFNGLEYANAGLITWNGPYANDSGTPFEPCEIEGSFLDVPAAFAVQVEGEPNWNRTPTSPGYGLNPVPSSSGFVSNLQTLSRDCGTCDLSGDPCIDDNDCPDGEVCETVATVSLNTNRDAPDARTMYDVVGAWVPVTMIANQGTGLENIKYSEAQHLFVTGRMPNGENLTGVTRDVGSGTRNAAMNSLGVDTSWGRGDNIGNRVNASAQTSLGPDTQPSNCGGSSILENSVEMHRLGIGYTGLAGGSRSAADAQSGKYEILSTCKDVSATDQAGCDCESVGYVRPGVSEVLDNCDPCTSFQIAGQGSFAFIGNPASNRDPETDPKYEDGPPLDNQAVADYINNILDSIDSFDGNFFGGECNTSRGCAISGDACTLDEECPEGETCDLLACDNDGDCPDVGDFCKSKLNMPGQLLATEFFLPAGLDCQNEITEPLKYSPVATNQVLQDFIRAESIIDVPEYGSVNPAGRVPKRNALSAPDQYSDGSTTGSYSYWTGSTFATITSGLRLSDRNRIQGDFNGDFTRDVSDAAELVQAYYAPRSWQQSSVANGNGSTGNMSEDNAIPEVLGDFQGDGNLTKEDLRYFADGLAMVDDGAAAGVSGRRLDRKAGAIAIDEAIASLSQPFPWADQREQLLIPPVSVGDEPTFETPAAMAGFLVTGKTYAAGDFRGDVAGANPTAGAFPMGWDGVVDDLDINYVCHNIGDWSNLDEAAYMDLSCDMNGDTSVTLADVTELVEVILGTQIGDFNLDGVVDATDEDIALSTIELGDAGCNGNESCGWADGDANCDGVVNSSDIGGGGDVPGALVADPSDADSGKNRYLSFSAPASATAGASEEAIRIRLDNLDGFESFNGEVRFVGQPQEHIDEGLGTFIAAPLQCEPFFTDWSGFDLINVYGAEIVPGSSYTAQRADVSCSSLDDEGCFSEALTIATAKWGDVAPTYFAPGGPAQPDFGDISALVDKFTAAPTSPPKARAQLQPNVPKPQDAISFTDIANCIDAFTGAAFPYAGPSACP